MIDSLTSLFNILTYQPDFGNPKCVIPPFNASAWKSTFGISVPNYSMPPKLRDKLQETCPFHPNCKIEQTHIPILIPADVQLKKLFPNMPLPTTEPSDKPYWIIITKQPLPFTQGIWPIEQEAAMKTSKYEKPTLFEAAMCIYIAMKNGAIIFYEDGHQTRVEETQPNGHPYSVKGDPAHPFIVKEWDRRINGYAGVIRYSIE